MEMTQEQVFSAVLGEEARLGQKYRNPFRDDKNPSCYFTKKSKWLRFIDPAANEFSGMNYIEFYFYSQRGRRIQNKEDYAEAMRLLESSGFKEVKPFKVDPKAPEKRFQLHLEFEPKPFTSADLSFWGQFGIHREHLEADGVYSVGYFKFNTKKVPDEFREIEPYWLCFALTRGDRTKIYQPHSEMKWLNNTNKNDVYRWPGEGRTLVFGSYKDGRMAANLGFKSMAMSFETVLPDELEGDEIIIGDFDGPGNKTKERFVDATYKPAEHFKGEVRLFETGVDGIKDPAEVYYYYGKDFTYKFLKKLAYDTY